jgi:PAS domain S-box-containing protein
MRLDEQALTEVIGNSPIAMVVTNPRRPDNPLELVNRAFVDLTGYTESEILGRNCRFLSGAEAEQPAKETLRSAVGAARPALVDILNFRRDGSPFRNGVMIAPLFYDDGELAWFLGSQVDLGDEAEVALSKRRSNAAELIAALPTRQREVLQGMAGGMLNKQIAWELKISEKTVKMHRALLLERLGASTSAEAIRIAVEAGL